MFILWRVRVFERTMVRCSKPKLSMGDLCLKIAGACDHWEIPCYRTQSKNMCLM